LLSNHPRNLESATTTISKVSGSAVRIRHYPVTVSAESLNHAARQPLD
jgi:hypothetical protein